MKEPGWILSSTALLIAGLALAGVSFRVVVPPPSVFRNPSEGTVFAYLPEADTEREIGEEEFLQALNGPKKVFVEFSNGNLWLWPDYPLRKYELRPPSALFGIASATIAADGREVRVAYKRAVWLGPLPPVLLLLGFFAAYMWVYHHRHPPEGENT